MITAETITDEQIRELRRVAVVAAEEDEGTVHLDGNHTIFSGEVVDLCDVALGHNPFHTPRSTIEALNMQLDARARCAEILNARAAKTGDR